MVFVLEWLDERARQENGVDVTHWVVDRERDLALWGKVKHWQQHAEGDASESFRLRIAEKLFLVALLPAPDFWVIEGKVYHEYTWERFMWCDPSDFHGMSPQQVVAIIKEALTVLGGGWYSNQKCPNFAVKFNF